MHSSYFEPAHRALKDHLFSRGRDQAELLYRYEHSLRVAHIGRRVAEAEGLDADRLELACLLHDIGKFDATVAVDHGRVGAGLAQPILEGLGLDEDAVREICQGIAMHVDGTWNFDPHSPDHPGHDLFTDEPSVLSRSVGDCDNVDRYSLLRIHGTMSWARFSDKPAHAAITWIDDYLELLDNERRYHCATTTAQQLWTEALDRHEWYFRELAETLKPADIESTDV
ncbi:HD domain-containing protein [Flaviflexus huanghaiensis]|uniref:HD domain-containing protein n=1 Tax=Flaviflexus huanghaiensis TaxID=1111473 RepID=UPI0015FBA8FF